MIREDVDYYASFNFDGTVSTAYLYGANELMQYTGLKDKNGVEIYEGDIVKFWTTAVAHLDGVIETGRVMYVYGAYRLCFSLSDDAYSRDVTFPYEYEVIGNIYENPELLEANK